MTFPNLEATLKSVILPRLAISGIRGTIKLEIRGDQGGTFYVKMNGTTELTTKPLKPDVILRATRKDFEALLTGRMSFQDGLLTERLTAAGDFAMLTRLGPLVAAPAKKADPV